MDEMKKFYQIDCAYPIESTSGVGLIATLETELNAIAGSMSQSGGSGFGMRDNQYGEYRTEIDACHDAALIYEAFARQGFIALEDGLNPRLDVPYINVIEYCDDCGCQHDDNEPCIDSND